MDWPPRPALLFIMRSYPLRLFLRKPYYIQQKCRPTVKKRFLYLPETSHTCTMHLPKC